MALAKMAYQRERSGRHSPALAATTTPEEQSEAALKRHGAAIIMGRAR